MLSVLFEPYFQHMNDYARLSYSILDDNFGHTDTG